MLSFRKTLEMPTPEDVLPGRGEPIGGFGPHLELGTPLTPPFPDGFEKIVVGMGCFWGADRPF